MKATFDIDEAILQRLQEASVQRETSISALVEAGLRHIFVEPVSFGDKVKIPRQLPTLDSGEFRIDVANREELYRIL